MNKKTISISIAVVVVLVLAISVALFYRTSPTDVSMNASSTATGTTPSMPGSMDSTPAGLPNFYANTTYGFSLYYPAGYTASSSYTYEDMGVGKGINGVKFTIDPAIASDTNLSSDSYLSVEEIPKSRTCTANLFLDAGLLGPNVTTTIDNGVTYSVGTATDAAAGNRYQETVYALAGINPCVAVRYYVHYGVFENYPSGTVTEFNQSALTAQFDAIRHTLKLTNQ